MKADIYFGSTCKEVDEYKKVFSPYDGRVASQVAVCSENDALKVLDIAQKSSINAKKTPLHVRVSWLLDVASKLEIQKEDMAQTITDEVGKPIKFSRVEVSRCIETIKLSANAMMSLNGETFDTTAMPSGKRDFGFL